MKVVCKGCSARLKATPKLFGKVVKCPKCRLPITVPLPAESNDLSPSQDTTPPPASAPKRPTTEQPAPKQSTTEQPTTEPTEQPTTEPTLEQPTTEPTTESTREPTQKKTPKNQPAVKSKRKTGSSKPKSAVKTILIALAFIALGVGALLYFSPAGSEEAKTDPKIVPGSSAATTEVVDVPPKKIPQKPKVPRPFEFYFGNPNSLTAYEAIIKCSAEGEKPVSTKGEMVFVTLAPQGMTPDLPALEVFTGLGIPGKQILVPHEQIEQADQISVTFQNQKYSAKVIERFPEEGFSVLSYDGPDFSALRISPVSEVNGEVNVLQFDPLGELETLVNVEFSKGSDGRSLANINRPWQSAVLYKQWGTVAGIAYKNDESNSVVGMSQITKHFEQNAFTIQTINSPSVEKVLESARENLVEVTVQRPKQNEDEIMLTYMHEFNTRRGSDVIHFPGFDMMSKVESKQQKILKSGKTVEPLSLNAMFPPGIFSGEDLTLFEIEKDKQTWKEDDKFFRLQKGESPEFISATSASETQINGATIYKLTARNRVLEREAKYVKVERVFSVVPFQTNPAQADEAEAFKCDAVQLIGFDLTEGKVASTFVKGSFVRDGLKVSLEMKLDLVDNARALAAFSDIAHNQEAAGNAPTKKLDPKEVSNLIANLNSSNGGAFKAGVTSLNAIRSEPNAKISNSVVSNLREYAWNSAGRNLCRNWIVESDLPRVLSAAMPQRKIGRTGYIPDFLEKTENQLLVLDLLMLHEPVSSSSLDNVKQIFKSSLDQNSEAVCDVLFFKYPTLLDSICMDYLKNDPKSESSVKVVTRLLGIAGTPSSIEQLQSIAQKANPDVAASIQSAIEKIKTRK